MLKYATFSPSAKNAQPWEAYVVAGERLDALRAKMDEAFRQGRGVPMHAGREMPAWQARARELSGALAPFLERQGWEPKSFIGRCLRFFDAPAAAIVCMDGEPSPLHLLDIGMFTQTLCLSAAGHGLASCIIAYTLIVEPVIREFLRLPAERRVMITVALGFPAKDQPMARTCTSSDRGFRCKRPERSCDRSGLFHRDSLSVARLLFGGEVGADDQRHVVLAGKSGQHGVEALFHFRRHVNFHGIHRHRSSVNNLS